mmetsp:Transcript_19105/g.52657  ORF Transcript_19105/g.52657 Transcript_19105/m.52657 type:complete len:230 (-) Transcript_19105:34-723(-)
MMCGNFERERVNSLIIRDSYCLAHGFSILIVVDLFAPQLSSPLPCCASCHFLTSSSVLSLGAGTCILYSIVYSPLPCVALRKSEEKPNILSSGTSASIDTKSAPSMLLMLPFLCEIRATAVPWNSLGTATSVDMSGSKRTGFATCIACLNAPLAAARNAISFESTACASPSCSTTRTPMTGDPVRTPCMRASRKPFSIAGTNSGGIEFPTKPFSNSNVPSPRVSEMGSM